MDKTVVGAYIAAAASMIVALIGLWGSWVARRSQQQHEKELTAQRELHDARLKRFEDELGERRAERDARREYEFEARKRLYEALEPLLFQLIELSENALGRIIGLARTAKAGNLSPGKSWLERESYYYVSTMHALMAPVECARLLQSRLTLVDLSVDPSVAAQYAIAKRVYASFNDDFTLAQQAPLISYDPSNRSSDRRQGVYAGWLETAADLLIDVSEAGIHRIRSFGEFANEYENQQSVLYAHFDRLKYLFLEFHPRVCPVLWRILVMQATLYRALLDGRDAKIAGRPARARPVRQISSEERRNFDWRSQGDQIPDREVFEDPFAASSNRLKAQIPDLCDF
jgi:hypothetical protein